MTSDSDLLGPFTDFTSAASALLHVLHDHLGVELSAVTRKSGDSWLALGAVERTGLYEVRPGTTWPWNDTVCARMCDGKGPRFAPTAGEVEGFRDVSYIASVGGYVGVPICRGDGQIFGTLCAFNPQPLVPDLGNRMPFLEMTARLLATLLEHELQEEEHRRKLEQVEMQALRDALTGLWNRRAWDRFLQKEDASARRYGHPICVMAIDLDGLKTVNDSQGHDAGDALIKRAAVALAAGVRTGDVVARLGGDEFGILAVHCSEGECEPLRGRLRGEMEKYGVEASIGMSMRDAKGLEAAFGIADDAMYEEKKKRHGSRGR